MRIGIDARELCGQATGAGRYLGGLLREWQGANETARRHEFVLYAPEPLGLALEPHRFSIHVVAGAPSTWWEQVRLPSAAAADHLDVFFAPAYSAPLLLRVPTVVAIHDVSFLVHPEWFRPREGLRRRWLTRRSAARARAVVTISHFSQREILETIGVPAPRVHVIPPGITTPPYEPAASRREERILFVGSIFNRRHVPDLVRSFTALARRRPAASLDLVGDNRTYPHEDLPRTIADAGLPGRIRWHRYAAEDQLADLYAHAGAFAFLSEYEGLGLTPLEALAAGVPPVLLDTPVARESCGNAALYVSCGDVEGTARALEDVLFNENTRARLLSAAPEVLARYRWPRAAQDTLDVIESAAGRRLWRVP
ncbi:MAG: glycosyltransferase family 1 protein [Acidobacteriota bacterium]